jgi:hypothetical protein
MDASHGMDDRRIWREIVTQKAIHPHDILS